MSVHISQDIIFNHPSLSIESFLLEQPKPTLTPTQSTMKISTALLLTTTTTTTFTFVPPHPTSIQQPKPDPAICPTILTLQLYVKDMNNYPTQSSVYMAQAQAFIIDDELHCSTKYGILSTEEPGSDACKKNQEIKEAIISLSQSSSEDKRQGSELLYAACVELDQMVGCPTK